MVEPRPGAEFPSTHWSLVDQARGPDSYLRREALDHLVRLYWPALRSHLVFRRGLTVDAADDLLQGFAADRIMRRMFLERVEPAKGRFRAFLLQCLKNYLIDHLHELKNSAESFDDEQHDRQRDPSPDAFDVAWAQQVLAESLRRMKADCEPIEQSPLWTLFMHRILQPVLTDSAAPSYDQLVEQFGFRSPQQASNLLVTAKRRFRRSLEDVVAEYVEDDDELAVELRELRTILTHAAPGTVALESLALAPLANFGEASAAGLTGPPTAADDSKALSLSQLLQIDGHRDSAWSATDLAGLLQHWLQLPLGEALPGLEVKPSEAPSGDVVEPLTLAELFAHREPPLSVLEAVKVWVRRATRDDETTLPTDLVSLVYFAAIAAAIVRRGQWISKLDPPVLRQGIEVLRAQPWVGEPIGELLQQFPSAADQRTST